MSTFNLKKIRKFVAKTHIGQKYFKTFLVFLYIFFITFKTLADFFLFHPFVLEQTFII